MITVWAIGGMPGIRVCNAPPKLSKQRGPGKFVVGTGAEAPAWTFGHEWAKYNFPGTWQRAIVHGVYVGEAEPHHGKPCAKFVWYTPDGEHSPQSTVLANVHWSSELVPLPEVMRHAHQALYVLLHTSAIQLRRGVDSTPVNLIRSIDIDVDNKDEFICTFLRHQSMITTLAG
jgi:hypothetical protein